MRATSTSAKRVCLVLAPFTPSIMPGLGVSLLKSTLSRAGIASDIYYAALDFFRFFTPHLSAEEAVVDFDLLASFRDAGELFFSDALWNDGIQAVHRELETMRTSSPVRSALTPAQIDRCVGRLHEYAGRVDAFIEFCYRQRNWDDFDLVGFSSTFSQNVASLALARRIRERHPQLHLVFGGANCEGEMGVQLLRSFPHVDAVIQGEADEAFPEYVQKWRSGESIDEIRGLVCRRDGQIHICAAAVPIAGMDDLPYPDYSDYFAQLPEILQHLNGPIDLTLPIETSRGCWWGAVKHCVFCGLNPTGMTFRSKSPARARAEYLALRDRYGTKHFYAVDNIIDRRYFTALLPQLEGAGLSIFYETKSNLSESEVRTFARAGVTTVQPGIEGLSTKLLTLMAKGVHGYQNIELLKWCGTHGVRPIWFMLYRFPHEPADAYDESVDLIPRIVHLPPPRAPNPVVIDRYSPYFTRRDAFGFRNVRPTDNARVSYRGLPDEDVFNLSYHFLYDLPQGNDLPYENALWNAVALWRRRYSEGAYFLQFHADHVTLLVDRRRDESRAYLLGGFAHRLHAFLRRAHRRPQFAGPPLRVADRWSDLLGLSSRDILLVRVAEAIGAELIDGSGEAGELDTLLTRLVERWILLHIDDRYLALATDCSRPEVAASYGLEEFADQALCELDERLGAEVGSA